MLGSLFSGESIDRERQELMIALIPHIVRRPEYTAENLRGIAVGKPAVGPAELRPASGCRTPAAAPEGGRRPQRRPQSACRQSAGGRRESDHAADYGQSGHCRRPPLRRQALLDWPRRPPRRLTAPPAAGAAGRPARHA